MFLSAVKRVSTDILLVTLRSLKTLRRRPPSTKPYASQTSRFGFSIFYFCTKRRLNNSECNYNTTLRLSEFYNMVMPLQTDKRNFVRILAENLRAVQHFEFPENIRQSAFNHYRGTRVRTIYFYFFLNFT